MMFSNQAKSQKVRAAFDSRTHDVKGNEWWRMQENDAQAASDGDWMLEAARFTRHFAFFTERAFSWS